MTAQAASRVRLRPAARPSAPRIFMLPIFALLGLVGCHSAFVETMIDNQSDSALRLIEVDYPSASFGVGNLAPHSQFHYRFKIQGSGPLKIEFTDAVGRVHNADGPILDQGQEGRLAILIDSAETVKWQPQLTVAK